MPSTVATSTDAPVTVAPKQAEVTTTIINSKTTLEVTETTTDKTDTSTIFVASTTKIEQEASKNTNEVTTQTTSVPDTSTAISSTSSIVSSAVTTTSPETKENSQAPSSTTVTTENPALRCHLGNCTLPSTWETTPDGETRDFVQILRERFGDRVKIMRDTTHFPKHTTMYYRKLGVFVPSRHRERLRFG